MFALRRSKWDYDTSTTGTIGFGPLLASSGTILLRDPTGQAQRFHYGGSGIGWGGSSGFHACSTSDFRNSSAFRVRPQAPARQWTLLVAARFIRLRRFMGKS